MSPVVEIVVGLVLLAGGGELLVRGAVRLAERFAVSPLVIGLTLVGFGTSVPELVTSVEAALLGSPGIAVGNVVGSNIANILLILGVAAVMSPVAVGVAALHRDGVLVVATAALLVVVAWWWTLDRWVGGVFVGLLVAYVLYAWRQERVSAPPASGTDAPAVVTSGLLPAATAVAGLVLVVVGGGLLVEGAIGLSRRLGVSETVIGLTVVAVGTSMPELVTTVVAAIRRQGDLALGNVLGSCIYNVLGIAGLTALIAPTPVPPEIARFDAPLLVVVAVALMVLAWSSRRIGRMAGLAGLVGYAGYLWANWQG